MALNSNNIQLSAEGDTIAITQVRSTIRRPETQQRVVKSLGLRRLHERKEVKNTPENRGRIRKVAHLLQIG